MTTAASPQRWPGFVRAERQHIATLERRRDHLAREIALGSHSWDRAEHGALTWVLDVLDEVQT